MGRRDGPGSAGFGAEASSYAGGYEQEAFGSPPDPAPAPPPSRGGTGVGRQDGPGSRTEGNQLKGIDALVEKINQDIDAGVNVFADSYTNKNARDILSNVYGDKQETFGIASPSVADKALKAIGYDTSKPFLTNVYDNVVPGRNTPLGILSAVPTVLGAPKAAQLAVTIGNRLAGSSQPKPEPKKPTVMEPSVPKIRSSGRQDYQGAPIIPEIRFEPDTVSPSGFTRIAARPTSVPPDYAAETDAEFDARMDRMFGEQYERDKARDLNRAKIDNYLQSQSDVGVFTPPTQSVFKGVDTRPLITMFGDNPMPERVGDKPMGGFADPLTDKTLFDLYNERMLRSQPPKIGI